MTRTSLISLLLPFLAVAQSEKDLPDLVERMQKGVANISSTTVVNYRGMYGWEEFFQMWGIPRERRQSSLGSGFIIDKEGFVITNSHVVERADEVVVTLFDKRRFRARKVGLDPKMDLALLQIVDKGGVPAGLAPLSLGNSERVRIAESVLAIGNPFGLQNTVTRGIISAKNRTIGLGPFDNFLQTDASINPGNSGGPLLNLKGEVVGINTVIYSRTGQSGGLGFAIPINEAKKILPDLKRYGRVPRPWLGVLVEKITPQLQKFYRLPRKDGVLVYDLVQRGPAMSAGVRQGDIIFEIDGKSTKDPNELERVLASLKPGKKVSLQVQRKKRKVKIQTALKELPRTLRKLPRGVI